MFITILLHRMPSSTSVMLEAKLLESPKPNSNIKELIKPKKDQN